MLATPALDFLALTRADDEERLLRHCADVLAQHGMREHCYFDRHRANQARGIALHWRAGIDPAPALADIVGRAGAVPGAPDVRFVPVVEDTRATLASVFGGLDSIDTYRAFSFDSAPLLWQWCDAGLGLPDKRMAVSVEILVDYMYRMHFRLSGKAALPYPGMFVSFRSHFEGFAATLDDPQGAERAFAQRYPAVEELLLQLVPAYETQRGAQASPWLQPMQTLVDNYFDGIYQRVLDRTLVTGMLDEVRRSGKNLLASRFHEKVVSSKEYTRHTMKQPLFQTNRILLGLVYLALFRLGLPLIERYFLCYALSRCIQERFGISAEQAFDRSIQRSARRRRLSWLGIHQ